MNSTTLAALFSGVGGAVFGAWLTGWFTVRVKKRKRVQQRRAEVYVDMLAWIGARMAWLTREHDRLKGHQPVDGVVTGGQPAQEGNGVAAAGQASPAQEPSARLGGLAGLGQMLTQASARLAVVDAPPQPTVESAPDVKKRATYPDPRSMLATDATDPDTEYFISLRARVAVFASHDMARAFDNWVEAYRLVLSPGTVAYCGRHPHVGGPSQRPAVRRVDPPADCRSSALRAIAYDRATGRKRSAEVRTSDRKLYKKTRLFKVRTKFLWRHDLPDGLPGYLTKAIEFCASEELRKG